MTNLKYNDIKYLDIRNIEKNRKDKLIISYNNNGEVCSYYSDNIWDLSYKVAKNNGNIQKRFVFEKKAFSDGSLIIHNEFYLNIYKDAIYQAFSKNLKTSTISSYFKNFFLFLDYCYTYHKNKPFSELTKEDVNGFISYLESEHSNLKSKKNIIGVVKKCLFYPKFNFSFSVDFEPFEDIIAKNLDKKSSIKNNQTKIIPDNIWSEIIGHCSYFIENFHKNIEIENKLVEVAEDALSNNAEHRFNLYFKKKLNSEISQYKTAKYYYDYLADLQIACGMIIQAFTGMRMSELQSLKMNCISNELLKVNGKEYLTHNIKGITFKYQTNKNNLYTEGKEVFWQCPEIVVEAVKTLELLTRISRLKVKYRINKLKKEGVNVSNLEEFSDILFISTKHPVTKNIYNSYIVQIVDYSQNNYHKHLIKHGLEFDFKLHSHCFRRTLARFLTRSLIDIEVEAIKEQFKHFSKDITLYYMREDRQLESKFAELLEEYNESEILNKDGKELIYDKMKDSLDNAILTANNLEELTMLTNGKQLKVVNEFVASINDSNQIFSPIDCLTCEGNVIIPKIHYKYWAEMKATYDELVEIEPNSIWYKKERDMIIKVIETLKENKIYITGEQK